MMKLRNAEKMQRRSWQLKTQATYAIAKGKREKTPALRDPNLDLFFRLYFRNCISCAFNCDDLVCINYFFSPRFQNMNFLYSTFNSIFFLSKLEDRLHITGLRAA